jgi:hypothetical protein
VDPNLIPIPSQNFAVREIDDETVFLAESGDEVLSLNAVGSFVWQQIDGASTLQDIVARICEEYEVDVEQARGDLEEFVRQLESHELVSWQNAEA